MLHKCYTQDLELCYYINMKIIQLTFTFTLALLCCSAPAMAQRHDRVPEGNFILPQRRIIIMDRRLPQVPIEMTQVAAYVLIANNYAATTSLTITLKNPNSRPAEASILLPTPEEAIFKGFSYGEREGQYPARLMPAKEARELYDAIVARALDPALMEFAGLAAIRTSVFPIPANSTMKVKLVYEQVLTPKNGRYDYVLPRSESLEKVSAWDIRVEAAGMPAEWVSTPSHEVSTNQLDNGNCVISIPDSKKMNPGAFRLTWSVPADKNEPIHATSYACPDVNNKNQGYFMVTLSANKEAFPKQDKPQRTVIFVLDRSGSMRGDKLDSTKESIKQMIAALKDGEAFNVIIYNQGVEKFAEQAQLKTKDSERAVFSWIDDIRAMGGTNMGDALKEALEQNAPKPLPSDQKVIVFMSDGVPTIGNTSEKYFLELLKEKASAATRIFTIGVGADVNAPLLRQMALYTRALPTFILPKENIELKVAELAENLQGPLLELPEFYIGDEQARPTPHRVQDLLPKLVKQASEAGIYGGHSHAIDYIREMSLLSPYHPFAYPQWLQKRLQCSRRASINTWPQFRKTPLPVMYAGNAQVIVGRYTSLEPFTIYFTADEEIDRLGKLVLKTIVIDPTKMSSLQDDFVARIWASRQIGELQAALIDLGADMKDSTALQQNPKTKEIIDEIIKLSLDFGIMSDFTSFFADDGSPGVMPLRATREHRDKAMEAFAPTARGDMFSAVKEKNIQQLQGIKTENKRNSKMNAAGQSVEFDHIAQIGQNAYYKKGSRWVENTIQEPEQKHDRSVNIGTVEYAKVATQLVQENRQSLLALEGDILVKLGKEFVLIHNSMNP